MSRILTIDTAGARQRIELAEDDRIVVGRRPESSRHVRELPIHIRATLAEAGWPLSSIDVIGVNIGPGSFTGIRVGLAMAKAIAYSSHIKLVGVDMFDAFALGLWHSRSWPDDVSNLEVVMEGQMQSVIVNRYTREGSQIHRGDVRIFPRSEFSKKLEPGVAVTGMLDRLFAEIPANLQVLGRAPWDEWRPSIRTTTWQRIREQRFDDAFALEPHYVRPSSAEEKWDADRSA